MLALLVAARGGADRSRVSDWLRKDEIRVVQERTSAPRALRGFRAQRSWADPVFDSGPTALGEANPHPASVDAQVGVNRQSPSSRRMLSR